MMLMPHICCGDHDDTGSLSGTSDTGDGEQFNKAGNDIAVGGNCRLFHKDIFLDKLGMDVVEVACRLEGGISEYK